MHTMSALKSSNMLGVNASVSQRKVSGLSSLRNRSGKTALKRGSLRVSSTNEVATAVEAAPVTVEAQPVCTQANQIATVATAAPVDPAANFQVALDTCWVLFCAYLVIFMNAGFAFLEAGFCRAKNCVHILAKNLVVFAISVATYYLFGFGFMFGDGNPFFGQAGFALTGPADNAIEAVVTGAKYTGIYSTLAETAIPLSTKFFFQSAFAATTVSIVSGAVAERIKFGGFCLFAFLLVGSIYGITGHWIWGGGWLMEMGFTDFAGCSAVHALGGWAALTGAKILGPRIGKYGKDAQEFPAHSLPLATLGTFILWLGWFGFNPGSVLAADAPAISHVALTTNLGACFGALGATVVEVVQKKGKDIDIGMIINGLLAGLVSITAACPFISIQSSMAVGFIGGLCISTFMKFVDETLKVDDPIGAIAVHLGGGILGTLMVGLFAEGPGALYADGPAKGLLLGGGSSQLVTQVIGVVAVGAFAFVVTSALWMICKSVTGIRVPVEDEEVGLDKSEHGQDAYVAAF